MKKLLKNAIKTAILSSALFFTTFSEKAKSEPFKKIAKVPGYSVPVLGDINNDGLVDLVVGDKNGNLNLFLNTGTATNPQFTEETETYAGINAGEHVAPYFCDINNNGKAELFMGNRDGSIFSYTTIGTLEEPVWEQTTIFQDIDTGSWAKPCFYDVDNDGDLDCLVGEYQGNLNLLENIGNTAVPLFELSTESFQDIDIGSRAAPFVCDFNSDGKTNLFIGRGDGKISWYEQKTTIGSWQNITDNYNLIDVGESSTIALADINHNGKIDAFIGAKNGSVFLCDDFFNKIILYLEPYRKTIRLKFEGKPQTESYTILKSSDLSDWTETNTITNQGYNEWIDSEVSDKGFYKIK